MSRVSTPAFVSEIAAVTVTDCAPPASGRLVTSAASEKLGPSSSRIVTGSAKA